MRQSQMEPIVKITGMQSPKKCPEHELSGKINYSRVTCDSELHPLDIKGIIGTFGILMEMGN